MGKSIEWATPQDLFDRLDAEFHFNLDPCATPENAKCRYYFTKKEDGLQQSWRGFRVFCNPPYGREIVKWVRKAYFMNRLFGTLVVMLLPARTDTKWFHDYVYGRAELRFIKGRVRFGNSKENAPFASMIVVYEEKGESDGNQL